MTWVSSCISVSRCGDGYVDPQAPDGAEVCDDGNTDATDACTAVCQPARCGDGVTQADVEQCDDGNTDNTDACTGCRAAACGDGFIQGDEGCDDGNTTSGDGCNVACVAERCR